MRPVVYIDVLFFLNFIINSVLFLLTGMIVSERVKIIRLMGVSALASIYTVLVFVPSVSFLTSGMGKILFSGFFIRLLFGKMRFGKLVKDTLIFLTLSFGLAGTVFALFFLTGLGTKLGAVMSGGEFYFNIDITYLFSGAILFYLLVAVFSENCKTVLPREELIKEIVIENDGKKIKVKALIDTGCHLKEPASARPVVIVPLPLGQRLCKCPKELERFYKEEKNIDRFTDLGLKIIPFCTVTGQWEIMAGFDAEMLEVDGKSYGKNDFVIAVSGYSFSDNFDGIINPEILTGGIKNEVDNKNLAEV